MTELNRPIKRKFNYVRNLRRPIMILIEPEGFIKLKEKGGRSWEEISIESLYCHLIAARVEKEREEKRRKR